MLFNTRTLFNTGTLVLLLMLVSCQKYLEVKPNKAERIPTTLEDALALLDNTQALNMGSMGATEIASDNIFVNTAEWQALAYTTEREAYVWGADVFNDEEINDWSVPYQAILYANTVLEILEGLPEKDSERVRQARGGAHFFRAWAYYGLAQEFCAPYEPATAATTLGLPLRKTSQVQEPLSRATIQQSYDLMLADGMEAAAWLGNTALYKTRPTRPAAYALLSRIWLSMGQYEKAGQYADSCLQLYNTLLDYNTLDANVSNPIAKHNEEVIFDAWLLDRSILFAPVGQIDTLLYRSYDSNDLRRTLFFSSNSNGSVSFRGSYTGSAVNFAGLATDEVYLNRAESRARSGNATGALQDLNTLLEKRFKTGTFTPHTASTPTAVLQLVLKERRKELLYRGIRWTDLRRLNRETNWATTLRRRLNSQELSLPPGDPRYVFQIPDKVIRLGGIEQNPR